MEKKIKMHENPQECNVRLISAYDKCEEKGCYCDYCEMQKIEMSGLWIESRGSGTDEER